MRPLAGRLDLTSINTATLGWQGPIEATIEAIARKGFGAISPWRRELEGKEAAQIGRAIRDAGLAVSGYCRSSSLTFADEAERRRNMDDNRRALAEAAAINAAAFVMVVGSLPEGSRNLGRAWQQVEDGTAELLGHAREMGVRLALEPLHPMYAGDRSCLNTLEQALDLAERIEPDPGPNPSLGVAVDVYHVYWDPKLAGQIARAGRQNRIFAFHVCDWLVPTRDLLLDRGMMGDGVIDIAGIRGLVEEAGYDGAVEVEIFSAENWWKRERDETLNVCAERLQSVC